MYKDEESLSCVAYLSDKKCALCEKFVLESESDEGIYNFFRNKFPPLKRVTKLDVKDASAIIRTFPVCQKHFRVLKKENQALHKLGLEIEPEIKLIKYRRSYL